MKLNSAPRRDKENKLIKDIADIYALLWHFDIQLSQLKDQLFSIIPREQVRKTIQNFSKDNLARVGAILGINKQEISRVLREFT
jgi:hypothetical protein